MFCFGGFDGVFFSLYFFLYYFFFTSPYFFFHYLGSDWSILLQPNMEIFGCCDIAALTFWQEGHECNGFNRVFAELETSLHFTMKSFSWVLKAVVQVLALGTMKKISFQLNLGNIVKKTFWISLSLFWERWAGWLGKCLESLQTHDHKTPTGLGTVWLPGTI